MGSTGPSPLPGSGDELCRQIAEPLGQIADAARYPAGRDDLSGDLPQAIAAGSTLVRVGTAVFGTRG